MKMEWYFGYTFDRGTKKKEVAWHFWSSLWLAYKMFPPTHKPVNITIHLVLLFYFNFFFTVLWLSTCFGIFTSVSSCLSSLFPIDVVTKVNWKRLHEKTPIVASVISLFRATWNETHSENGFCYRGLIIYWASLQDGWLRLIMWLSLRLSECRCAAPVFCLLNFTVLLLSKKNQ